MKHRLRADVSVAIGVVFHLGELGRNVQAVQEIDPRTPDRNNPGISVEKIRIVVTMDRDFGYLVYESGRTHCGALLLEELDRGTKNRITSQPSLNVTRVFAVLAQYMTTCFIVPTTASRRYRLS